MREQKLTNENETPGEPAAFPGLKLRNKVKIYLGGYNSVAFSSDGKRLATGAGDGIIRLVDVETGEIIQTLEGHSDWVRSVAFSPDGKLLASGSSDMTIRIWDAETGRLLKTFESHRDYIRCVAFSPDGQRLASGSDDKTIRLWDLETNESIQVLEGHSGYVNSVVFSPDGQRLASGSYDKTIQLWEIKTGRLLQTLEDHLGYVTTVAFSPNGKRLASGSWDKTIRLWDLETNESIQVLEGHSGYVNSVVFSPDGQRLASGSDDKTIRLWDLETNESIQVLEGHSDWVRSVAFSPDGKQLASGSWDKTIRLWNGEIGILLQAFEGHSGYIYNVAFSPDGKWLASGSYDKTVRLWDVETGKLLQTFEGHSGHVNSVVFSPDGKWLASGSGDSTVRLWESETGRCFRMFEGHSGSIWSVAFSPDGKWLASGSYDKTVRLWDVETGKLLQTFEGHSGHVNSVVFSPDGKWLASGSGDSTVRLWESETGRCFRMFEGHSGSIWSVAFSPDGKWLASGSGYTIIHLWPISYEAPVILESHTASVTNVSFSPDGETLVSESADGVVLIWDLKTLVVYPFIPEPTAGGYWGIVAVFHSYLPRLLTYDRVHGEVYLWDVEEAMLRDVQPADDSLCYSNAKIVLVGDSGVGKSGLALVLRGEEFKPTESTHGRFVWLLASEAGEFAKGLHGLREVYLWDLAGQPGYRLVHQLHLHEVTVALVLFDARNETDPFAGVRHWNRALRQARQTRDVATPLKKFLVAARTDVGGVGVSRERIQELVESMGFDGYFETSAKENWGIVELYQAIRDAIEWGTLPRIASNRRFQEIKAFLKEEKDKGRLLTRAEDLYHTFLLTLPAEERNRDFRPEFRTCIGRLENADLLRRLSFGDLILLQPELLDAYASAVVEKAKSEPDGMGSIRQEDIRERQVWVPGEVKIVDAESERLLLAAMVEDLLKYEIALLEPSNDGNLLVFPSQMTRENPELPDPKGRAVHFEFDGAVLNLYATLAVRLTHSGVFSKAEIWKNAVLYSTPDSGTYGVFLEEKPEGHGTLTLFFNERSQELLRFQFEEFIQAHLNRRAIPNSISRRRIFICPECGEVITDSQAQRRRARGHTTMDCPVCDSPISLLDREERLNTAPVSRVPEMDRAADARRDYDVRITSAKGEMSTPQFRQWVGADQATLALIFTDVVGSTALGVEVGNEGMREVRHSHFNRARDVIERLGGYEIKTIGDSFMAAFRTSVQALNFALDLYSRTGVERVRVRAGIHVGKVEVDEDDAFGNMVNFTSRVVGKAGGAEIWVSERAKWDIDEEKAKVHQHLQWEPHPDCDMKGFPGHYTLWSIKNLLAE